MIINYYIDKKLKKYLNNYNNYNKNDIKRLL
jgi:hypothetical protein